MYDQLASNQRRSFLLIGGFVLVVLGMGWLFSYLFGGGIIALVIAAVVATFMAFASYRSGDKIVLRMSRAREVSHAEEPRLHNLVDGLAIAAGMPKPKVYVVDDPAPNAFATGRDPAHASVAFTTGLLEKMNRVELEGVVAHELAHIKNRDTLVMAIVATLVGIVVLTVDWMFRSLVWGGMRRRGNDGGASGIIAVVVLLIAVIVMPLFARIMQAAVSRRREFYADMQGVQLTRYPPGLVSALRKLKEDTTTVKTAVRATGHLWIESPLEGGDSSMNLKLNRLFSTHPPLDERIRVLQEL